MCPVTPPTYGPTVVAYFKCSKTSLVMPPNLLCNRCTDPTSTARPGYAAVAAGTAGTVIGPIGNSSSFGSSPARVARQRFGASSMYLSRGQ